MAKKPRTGQGWHREDIKAELRKRYGTLKAFAEGYGLDESNTRAALNRPYPKFEALIARALGTTPQAIWPERYTDEVMNNHRHWRRHDVFHQSQSITNVTDETVNKAAGT